MEKLIGIVTKAIIDKIPEVVVSWRKGPFIGLVVNAKVYTIDGSIECDQAISHAECEWPTVVSEDVSRRIVSEIKKGLNQNAACDTCHPLFEIGQEQE